MARRKQRTGQDERRTWEKGCSLLFLVLQTFQGSRLPFLRTGRGPVHLLPSHEPHREEVLYFPILHPHQTNRKTLGSHLLTCSSGAMRAWVDSSPSEGCRRLLVEGRRGAENRGPSPGQPGKPLEKLETV